MSPIPIQAWDGKAHEEGESRVIHLDLSKDLSKLKSLCDLAQHSFCIHHMYYAPDSRSHADTEYPATGMNQLASFVRIKTGEAFTTKATATSQVFYCIRWV